MIFLIISLFRMRSTKILMTFPRVTKKSDPPVSSKPPDLESDGGTDDSAGLMKSCHRSQTGCT